MSSKVKLAAIVVAALLVLAAVTQLDLAGSQVETLELEAGAASVAAPEDLPHAPPVETERAEAAIEPPAAEPAAKALTYAFPPRPASEVATLELRILWSDGRPAAGVTARLMPWGSNDAFLHVRTAVTDEDGVAVVEQLAPGKLGIYLDRCNGEQVELTAGAVTVHELRIPEGVTIRGRVLDPEGAPVPFATICLSAHGNRSQGYPIARADSAGQYALRDLSDQRYVSARAPGFAPSDQLYSKGAAGGEIELDLRLRGEAGGVRGLVLAPNGEPAVGARVQLEGSTPVDWKPAEDGRRRAEKPLPFQLRTDEAGQFSVDEVGAGNLKVLVRSESCQPAALTTHILPGTVAEVEIQLREGGTLEGVVHHADGTPADGVTIATGGYGNIGSVRGRSRQDGSYRVEGLPLGTFEFWASKYERGTANEMLEIVAGTPTRWDVTLVEGSYAEGVVVSESGEPLTNWLVGVSDGSGLWFSEARTEADGTFRLNNIAGNARSLSVGPPYAHYAGTSLVLENALPATGPIRIVVPDDRLPSASVELSVRVHGGPAPSETQVAITSPGTSVSWECFPDEQGRVVRTGLIPGEYEVTIRLAEHAPYDARFSVAPEESADLGVVTLGTGGRVELLVSGGGPESFVQAIVLSESGVGRGIIDLEDGRGLSSPLPPGPVRLRVQGWPIATEIITAEVVDGETTEVRYASRPGTRRRVQVRSVDDSALPQDLELFAFTDSGAEIVRRSRLLHRRQLPQLEVQINGLEIGTYRVVATASGYGDVEAQLIVTTLEERPDEVLTLTLE